MPKPLDAIVAPLLLWYRQNARALPWRADTEPYHVWLSEIMLQQTRVEAVLDYYSRFLEAAPDVAALAALPDDRLYKLWEGLGYYARARNLKKAAQILVEDCGGVLPNDYAKLRTLPGVGTYTAGAIASIAFDLPCPAVDGNVLRVLARLLGSFDDIAQKRTKVQAERLLAEIIPPESPGDFTQALMELGAVICLPNGEPRCESCPLAGLCAAKKQGLTRELPVKKALKAREIQQKTMLVLLRGDTLALWKREAPGLLHGMWELPNLDGWRAEAEIRDFLVESGCAPLRMAALPPRKHLFTHIEWQMRAFLAEVSAPGIFDMWVTRDQLRENYAVPSAFQSFIPNYF